MNPMARQAFIKLGWQIIEWKVAYYLPDRVHPSRRKDYEIDDDTYDAHERRYLTLCRQLDQRNSVVHKAHPGFEDVGTEHAMMEVDEDRLSVHLALRKLGSLKRRTRIRR